jgi:hypothetical protein
VKASVTAVLISVTAAALVAFFWQQQKVAAETRALQRTVAELNRARQNDSEQERPHRESDAVSMLRLAALAASVRSEPGARPPAKPETHQPPADAPGDSTEPDSAPVEAVLANMASSFDAEPRDPSWASGAAKTIQDSVHSLLSKDSTIESVECRSSMCRLQSVQQDLDEYRKFVQQVIHSDVCKECFFTQTGQSRDGRPILTMYMARAGQALPRPD